MRCQVCGAAIADTSARECPRCGSALVHVAVPPIGQVLPDEPAADAGAAPSNMTGDIAGAAPQSGATPSAYPSQRPMPPPGWAAPPYSPYGYGYAGPPAGPAMPPGYAPPPPVSYPPLPPVTARRTRTWLIVCGAIAAVLVACALAASGLYVLRARLLAARSTPTGEPSNLQPVATDAATPATITLLPGWKIVYHDSLTQSSTLWPNDTHCFFGTGGYHVKDGYICPPALRAAPEVDIVVQVKQFGGDQNTYGIALRYTRGVGLYEFLITRSGYWGFYACDLAAQQCSAVIRYAHNDALREGQDTLNTLEARAVGTHFTFSLNGTQVGQADDSTYATGLTALFADQDMECVFSNLTIAQPG